MSNDNIIDIETRHPFGDHEIEDVFYGQYADSECVEKLVTELNQFCDEACAKPHSQSSMVEVEIALWCVFRAIAEARLRMSPPDCTDAERERAFQRLLAAYCAEEPSAEENAAYLHDRTLPT